MADEVLAYLLTFRCYGTWLPGDARGYTGFKGPFGAPLLPPDPTIEQAVRNRMRHPAAHLTPAQRSFINDAVPEICATVGWTALAVNARSNHVHIVAAGAAPPERMLTTIKSWLTRRLRAEDMVDADRRLWSRHGSTVYLWTDDEVANACAYVIDGQDWQPERG